VRAACTRIRLPGGVGNYLSRFLLLAPFQLSLRPSSLFFLSALDWFPALPKKNWKKHCAGLPFPLQLRYRSKSKVGPSPNLWLEPPLGPNIFSTFSLQALISSCFPVPFLGSTYSCGRLDDNNGLPSLTVIGTIERSLS